MKTSEKLATAWMLFIMALALMGLGFYLWRIHPGLVVLAVFGIITMWACQTLR
jgi:hypothetical protein